MSEGKRPGGLTALAVLNFVCAGFCVIAILGRWERYTAASSVAHEASIALQGTALGQDMANAASAISQGSGVLLVSLILFVIYATLLIVSGIGYIGQKKILGQRVGSIYGMIGIAGTVLVLLVAKTGFGIETIIGLTYPILTLVLLNTTFKQDFVNP